MKNKKRPNHKNTEYRTDENNRQFYGKDVIVIRLGHVNIVHLDHPNKEEIQKRTEEVIREEMTGEAFFDNCPLCRELQKHPYDIVYYEQDAEGMTF